MGCVNIGEFTPKIGVIGIPGNLMCTSDFEYESLNVIICLNILFIYVVWVLLP